MASVSPESSLQHSPDFSCLPTTFVLTTHLTLEELDEIEDMLSLRRAPLTYNIFEARLVLGKITRKARAQFELRRLNLWTEEIIPKMPASKKRKLSESAQEEVSSIIPTKEKSVTSVPMIAGSSSHADEYDHVKVVRLDWLHNCVRENRIIPIKEYLIYEGRSVPKPVDLDADRETNPTLQSKSQTRVIVDQGIMERARQDAVHTRQEPTRHISPGISKHTTRQIHLMRETTSEHEGMNNENEKLPDWVKERKIYACQRSSTMPYANEEFVNELKKIRHARILQCDEIGVRAYSTSIAAIAAYPYTLSNPRQVLALPGCDVKIAQLFREFQNDGIIHVVQELESDPVLKILNTFYDIWGVGARTAQEFYYDRGWKDLDDIIEFGWNDLTRAQQIGLKYYEEFKQKIPRQEVASIGSIVLEHTKRATGSNEVELAIVGGYRRGKQESGDVDLILSHRDPQITKGLIPLVVKSLEEAGYVVYTLIESQSHSARDQQTLPYRSSKSHRQGFDSLDKAFVVWQDPHRRTSTNEEDNNTNIHRRVDILVSPWRTMGCAVLGWSGDTTFQRDIRRYAKHVKAWKFDSTGIRDRASGEVQDVEDDGRLDITWEEKERKVFAGLDLEYREPWERCTG